MTITWLTCHELLVNSNKQQFRDVTNIYLCLFIYNDIIFNLRNKYFFEQMFFPQNDKGEHLMFLTNYTGRHMFSYKQKLAWSIFK